MTFMITSHKIKIIVYMMIFAYSGITLAQTPKGTEVLNRFQKQFRLLDKLILNKEISAVPATSSIKTISTAVWSQKGYSPAVDSAITSKSLAKISELSAATGLKLTGQTYYRPDEALGIDDDDNAESRYKAKVQAEVRWDFFHSSLYKRKGRVNEVVIGEQIDRENNMKDNRSILLSNIQENIRRQYDKTLAGVLFRHIDNLSLLSDAQEYLLENENISSDQLLNILNEKAECERQLATLDVAADCPKAANLSTPRNVTVTIDTLRLFDEIRRSQYDSRIMQLRMKLLDQQMANTTYMGSTTISPFVRYSYYIRQVQPSSSNVDAGVVFTIPLSRETARKRKTMKAERDLIAAQKESLETRVIDRARMIVDDINRMNRAANGELQRLRELKRYIAMRMKAYNNNRGGYNFLARAKEYNSYFVCWEKLLTFQYQRDCQIANIQEFLADTPISNFCSEVNQ